MTNAGAKSDGPADLFEQQVEAALTGFYGPEWAVYVHEGQVAPKQHGDFVTDSRAKMRRALAAARQVRAVPERIAVAVQRDGGLAATRPYLAWGPGDATVTLDGRFTAAELRAVADHIDRVARRARAGSRQG